MEFEKEVLELEKNSWFKKVFRRARDRFKRADWKIRKSLWGKIEREI